MAGAKAGYVAYWKALDEVGAMGGADKATKAMKDTMTGRELKIQTKTARQSKKDNLSVEGRSVVEDMVVDLVNLNHEPALIKLRTCVDFSDSQALQDGKQIPGAPKAFQESPEIHFVDGKWKVEFATNETVEKCA